MNDEIDLNHLIKKVKNLSILITMNFKKLLKCLSQTDLPIIEKKNILNQLNYILTEISFNFQSNVCTNEAKLYIFLCTFDFKLIETILQLIALNEDLFKEETNKNETNQSQTNESLKTVLNSNNLSIICLKKHLNDLERIKLIALSFLGYITVEYCYFIDSSFKSNTQNEFNSIGKNLKNSLIKLIYNSYFEKKSDSITLKDEILSKKNFYFELLSILIFLNSFKQKNCSILNWKEYRFCLNVFESLLTNNYFNLCQDPIISRLLLRILSEYSDKLLMVNAYLSWYEANLSQIVPNLSSQLLNALKTSYTNLEKIQDQYIEIVNFIHSNSCLNFDESRSIAIKKNPNLSSLAHYSHDCLLEIGRLVAKALKMYRIRIIHFNFRTKNDDDFNKKLKKEFVKRLNQTFNKLLQIFDRNIKNNKLKLNILTILIKSAFDRYLFRDYLAEYLKHEPNMSNNIFEEKDIAYFELKSASYLSCLSYFAVQQTDNTSESFALQNKKSSSYLINDEFEISFFDKFYSYQMENDEILV